MAGFGSGFATAGTTPKPDPVADTAVADTALAETALAHTALDHTALAHTALDHTALAHTAWVRVDFDQRAVTRTLVHGYADRATGREISADDPVRVASISKLVVGIAVLRLVESGALALDQDVSEYLGWSLRHPAFPDIPITLELLLSHRAGLSDAAGYVGHTQTVLRQQLAQRDAWHAQHAPGTWFDYANIGFPVVAAVIERVTGERFDQAMARLVLTPLGPNACFNWASCPTAAIARAAVLYDASGAVTLDQLNGQRPSCPVLAAPDGSCALDGWQPGVNGALFSPQGGLRISANDLVRIGQLLLNHGELAGVRLLRAESVQTLFQPRWTFDGNNGTTAESGMDHGNLFCRYGLASQTLATPLAACGDDLFGDGRARVGHAGDAYGLVSGLWLDREAGTGTTFFAIGGDNEVAGIRSAFYRVEESVVEQ
ncbi:MAG: serine hydrolase domain-containing protein [Gammaproteobacteria bacterium]